MAPGWVGDQLNYWSSHSTDIMYNIFTCSMSHYTILKPPMVDPPTYGHSGINLYTKDTI
jgi:hypothetical protein